VIQPSEAVLYHVEDHVAYVVLNQPAHRNALSAAVREGLWSAWRRFAADPEARVAILTGTGDQAFCAGADLKEMAAEGVGVPGRDYVPILGRNVFVDKPVIAAVNGAALGGGFMLAMMCDLAVAADHAVFGMPEARWGRGAPWSVPLQGMIPRRVWMELALTGDPIDARRAYEIGLVNAVVPRADLMPTARRLAARIVANAPLTVAATRRMIHLAGEMGRTAAWDVADALFEPVYRSEDAQEGPRAFREGRAPRWANR
jgi:enoyl-CoA hydratase